ncbi:MAG: OmpA family protein [Deltaproteobacteria bacterium]|jgi:chemotaxis protein MotB
MEKPQGEDFKARLEISEHKRVILQKRLSRGNIEEDLTLWSFVDLMTLLLILFILFYSHAVSHKGTAREEASTRTRIAAVESFEVHKTATAAESAASYPDPPKLDQPEPRPVKPDAPKPDPVKLEKVKTGGENPDKALEQFKQAVLQTVPAEVKKDFSIRWNQKRLVLVLGERIAFNVGEANILPDFQPALKRIAEYISSQKGYNVTVAGHTDDTPINTARFPSNWELSAIRAVNVAKFMISNGVNPHRISTEGYSSYRPVNPNTTVENRHTNRRVEITLIKAQVNEILPEQPAATPFPDAYPQPDKTVSPPTYLQKSYSNIRGYLLQFVD